MMKTLALLLFTISFSANAVIIPPATSSKGYGESNYSTTFGFDFQYFPITRSGSKATLGVLRVDGGGTGTGTAFTQGSVLFAGASGVYSQNNSNFFWDNSNTRLGLGLTAPTSKLHVDGGNATASAIKMTAGTTTGQASTDGYEFGIDSSGNGEIRQREALEVRLFTNNTQRVTVQSGGNVGIGTAAPGSTLDVGGRIQMSNAGTATWGNTANQGILSWNTGVAVVGSQSGQSLSFSTNSNSGTGEKMRIDTSGNVGIGTTGPGSTLHLAGSYQAAVSALTTNTTLDATHQVVTVDASGGARTITLPDCVAGILGRIYRIKKIDSSANAVTIARTGSDDTFDGATSYSLTSQYQFITLICVSTTLWGIY